MKPLGIIRIQPVIDRPEQILTYCRSDNCLDPTRESQQEEHLEKQQNTGQNTRENLDCSSTSNEENTDDSHSSKYW